MVKKVYSVSLEPEVYKQAQKYARFNGYRSVSQLVEQLLLSWLVAEVVISLPTKCEKEETQ